VRARSRGLSCNTTDVTERNRMQVEAHAGQSKGIPGFRLAGPTDVLMRMFNPIRVRPFGSGTKTCGEVTSVSVCLLTGTRQW